MTPYSDFDYRVEPFTEDVAGRISWGNLGNIMLRCASMHAGLHGFGYEDMIKGHHVWVLSRLVIDIDERPRSGEPFSIRTWVDKLYRQFTDRHFSVLRPDGSAYGHASSIWALIDTETRLPADLTQLPEGSFADILMPGTTPPIAPMARMRMKEPQLVATHKAAYCDLDINGHVNSIRYIELMLNRLDADAMRSRGVRRIEVAYCLEAYCHDELQIWTAADEANPARTLFEIRKTTGEVVVKAAFTLRA